MVLCLDVGNSQIYGGVFKADELIRTFRFSSKQNASSDEIGLFLVNVLRENDIDPKQIENISVCTVVPQILHSIQNACLKYFKRKAFVLEAGVKTGLKIKYKNPIEVGADRIANSIAASHLFPGEDVIVVDFGTATTFCVIDKNKNYQGGVILPGIRLCMEALEQKTAKLPSVEIKKAENVIGKTTVCSIQSGLYFGHLFSVKGILNQINKEQQMNAKIIGTGGFSSLFQSENIFNEIEKDLVLKGLYLALNMNL